MPVTPNKLLIESLNHEKKVINPTANITPGKAYPDIEKRLR